VISHAILTYTRNRRRHCHLPERSSIKCLCLVPRYLRGCFVGCGLDPDQCVLGIEAGCFFEEIGDPLAELIQNIAERGGPMKIRSELIRKRSYEIWQREGCPNGCDLAHWLRAEAELEAESQRIDVPYANRGYVWPRPPISRPPRKSVSRHVGKDSPKAPEGGTGIDRTSGSLAKISPPDFLPPG
jgi:hypothetical protein